MYQLTIWSWSFDLQEAEQLSPDEQLELIEISDQIEEANAARMPFLIELAELRKISLETLIEQLDLKQ